MLQARELLLEKLATVKVWFGEIGRIQLISLLVLPGLLVVGYVGWQMVVPKGQAEVKVLASQHALQDANESAKTDDLKTGNETIVIDVSGAVVNPGVKELPKQSRVSTALEVSGGFSNEADTTYVSQVLNFAQILEDGDKLYIPTEAQVKASMPTPVPLLTKINTQVSLLTKANGNQTGNVTVKASPTPSPVIADPTPSGVTADMVDINKAGETELDELPGIGPATAAKIVEGRPYVNLNQLCLVINNSKTCSGLEGLVKF